jgi:hypothetical protein
MPSLHITSAAALLLFASAAAVNDAIQLNVPKSPPAGTQTLSSSFQGYSMEMASFPSIAGNVSYATPLTNARLVLISNADLQTNCHTVCFKTSRTSLGLQLRSALEALLRTMASGRRSNERPSFRTLLYLAQISPPTLRGALHIWSPSRCFRGAQSTQLV